jgi:hypothetical protein
MSKGLAGPYPSGEGTVIRRSQRYFYENNHSRPIQVRTYIGTEGYFFYFFAFLGFWFNAILSKFKFTLNLLLKYPKLFSLGFSGSEPLEENRQMFQIVTTVYGRGWKDKEVDETYGQKEDSWIVAKVTGRDGYEITGICVAASALVLLDGGQRLPKKGGVYTTAAVFTDTDLVQMLQRHELKFDICGQGTL